MPLNVEKIRAICFDVDGTLSDTDDAFVARLAKFIYPFHFLFSKRDVSKIARRLVMASEAPANFLMGIPDALGLDRPLAWLFDRISRIIGHRPKKNFLLIKGVQGMLKDLSKRYPLAVVSVRDARSTLAFLDQFNLRPFFTCIASSQTCRHTKPYPDPILWVAGQLNVPAETCLMVGDTTVDVRSGRAAGAQTVGVLCGFGEELELRSRGADMILSSTADLKYVMER
jgi:N-acetyl-D-muramate 6-phosphate phosphatase